MLRFGGGELGDAGEKDRIEGAEVGFGQGAFRANFRTDRRAAGLVAARRQGRGEVVGGAPRRTAGRAAADDQHAKGVAHRHGEPAVVVDLEPIPFDPGFDGMIARTLKTAGERYGAFSVGVEADLLAMERPAIDEQFDRDFLCRAAAEVLHLGANVEIPGEQRDWIEGVQADEGGILGVGLAEIDDLEGCAVGQPAAALVEFGLGGGVEPVERPADAAQVGEEIYDFAGKSWGFLRAAVRTSSTAARVRGRSAVP